MKKGINCFSILTNNFAKDTLSIYFTKKYLSDFKLYCLKHICYCSNDPLNLA